MTAISLKPDGEPIVVALVTPEGGLDNFLLFWERIQGVWQSGLITVLDPATDHQYPAVAVDGVGVPWVAFFRVDDPWEGGARVRAIRLDTGEEYNVADCEIGQPSIAVTPAGDVAVTCSHLRQIPGGGDTPDLKYSIWSDPFIGFRVIEVPFDPANPDSVDGGLVRSDLSYVGEDSNPAVAAFDNTQGTIVFIEETSPGTWVRTDVDGSPAPSAIVGLGLDPGEPGGPPVPDFARIGWTYDIDDLGGTANEALFSERSGGVWATRAVEGRDCSTYNAIRGEIDVVTTTDGTAAGYSAKVVSGSNEPGAKLYSETPGDAPSGTVRFNSPLENPTPPYGTDFAFKPGSSMAAACWYETDQPTSDLVLRFARFDPLQQTWLVTTQRRFDSAESASEVFGRACSLSWSPGGGKLGLSYFDPGDALRPPALFFDYSPTGGATWTGEERVYTGGGLHNDLTFVSDLQMDVRVAFTSNEDGMEHLAYAERLGGGAWTHETVTASDYSGRHITLGVFDHQGGAAPTINYRVQDANHPAGVHVETAWNVAGGPLGWQVAIVDTNGDEPGFDLAATTDSQTGESWLAYGAYDGPGGDLRLYLTYASAIGGPWSTILAAGGPAGDSVGTGNSVQLDMFGNVAVAYEHYRAFDHKTTAMLRRIDNVVGDPYFCRPRPPVAGSDIDSWMPALDFDSNNNPMVLMRTLAGSPDAIEAHRAQ